MVNNYTNLRKIDQAIRFVDFYNSAEVKEMIARSIDTNASSKQVLPYLLPESERFSTLANVSSDPYYRQFFPVIRNMTTFPTGGLRGNMITVYYPVTQALNITGIDMDRQPGELPGRPVIKDIISRDTIQYNE
ncbi:MAG: hypothetical protein WC015_09515 [Methanoregula sp.]